MERLREYVISVTAAAIICGIVTGLSQKDSTQKMLKLVCGLFLAVTVVRPITRIDLTALTDVSLISFSEAEEAAAMGENLSRNALAELIKEETEAYILDKAAERNVSLEAEVTVSGDSPPVPVSVTLSGAVSPYARQQLEQLITEDLGIAKENQRWTG